MAARGMTWFAGRVALAALVLTFPAAISARDRGKRPRRARFPASSGRRRSGSHHGRDAADRLLRHVSLRRADPADQPPLRVRRPRVRGREERPDQGLRQPARHDPDGRSPTCGRSRRLLGPRPARPRPRPGLPGYAVRLRPLHLRRAALGGTGAGLERRLPDAAGADDRRLRRQRPAVAAPASAATVTGAEQVLIDDWCQQYPSHSIGDLALRPRRRCCTSAAATARASPTPTTARAARLPDCEPLRRSAGRRRDGQTPPTAEGGALRSQSLARAAGEPVLLNGDVLRVDPGTGAGAAGNPLASAPTRTRGGSSRTACATRSGSPSGLARASSGSATSAGTTWEEIDRRPTPTAQRTNFGWPCYEGAGRSPGTRAPG